MVGTNGETKTGWCDELSQVDAVLSFAPYMLPPEHPEHPEGEERAG
jgi:hypothetical protein